MCMQVFTLRNRDAGRLGNFRIARKIFRYNRLFKPQNILIAHRLGKRNRLRHIQRIIGVNHEVNVGPD